MLIYTNLVKPYENETLNKQGISNEFFILGSSYFMLIFSGWIPDDQKLTGTNLNLKNTLGLVMFVLIALNFLTNIAIVCAAMAKEGKTKLKVRRARKIHLKNMEIKASIKRTQLEIQSEI